MGDRDRKTTLYEQFARVGKALASGKRLELLDLLAQGERDVASLAAAADLGVTTASAHLQTLRRALPRWFTLSEFAAVPRPVARA